MSELKANAQILFKVGSDFEKSSCIAALCKISEYVCVCDMYVCLYIRISYRVVIFYFYFGHHCSGISPSL